MQYTILEKVENALQEIGVTGISVTYIKGYGDYANFFQSPLWSSMHESRYLLMKKKLNRLSAQNAHTGLKGDGLVTVLPVEHIYKISTQSETVSIE